MLTLIINIWVAKDDGNFKAGAMIGLMTMDMYILYFIDYFLRG